MTIRMTEQEAVSYLTPHHLTSDAASIGLTAGKMREAMDTLHGVVAAKTARIASLEALARELAGALVKLDQHMDFSEPAGNGAAFYYEDASGINDAMAEAAAALSHPLVSELTGEKEGGE